MTSNNFQSLTNQPKEADNNVKEYQPIPKRQHHESVQNKGGDQPQDPSNIGINTQDNSSPMPSQEIPSSSTTQEFDVLMDEDMEDLYLGELDLLGLEDA
jgi:hypothetical protein